MFKKALCAAALVLATTAGASAAPVTYNIAFTGYCDGMSLTVYQGIYVTGNSTGCSAGVDQGLQAAAVKKFSGLIVTGNQGNAPTLYTYSLNLGNKVWALYTSDGTHFTKINGGKFTLGAAPGNTGKSSFSQ